MDKEETRGLYTQGLDAWNVWAQERLARRKELIESEKWMAQLDSSGELQGKNQATQDWLAAAMSDFSEYSFMTSDLTDFVFPGDARFSGATFPQDVRFNRAIFASHAEFSKVVFPGSVTFDEATFTGSTWFNGVRFVQNTSFNNVTFSSDAIFQKVEFGSAEFKNATFTANACFREAIFFERVVFREAKFIGNAEFYRATFVKSSAFYKTRFIGDTKFRRAIFKSHAIFNKTQFTGRVEFTEAKFNGNTFFDEATFEGNVTFNQAIFESSTSFLGVAFQESASFVAMRGLSFFTLEQAPFFLVPDFGQVHFAEAPRLDNSLFGTAFQGYWWKRQKSRSVNTDVTARWRTLKRLAVQGHDYERELLFLAEEIKSSRGVRDHMLPNPLNLPKDRKIWPGGGRYWAGLFYQGLSDFGRSTARPFLWLVITTVVFAFGFHSLSPHSCFDGNKPISIALCSDNPMTAALYLSVNNGLVISVLGRTEVLAKSYACLYGIDGKNGPSPNMPYEVVFASLFQTIISAVLIFLFLLGLRNYFRIK